VATLEFVIRKRLEWEVENLAPHLDELESARKLRQIVDLVTSLPFPVNLWRTQNALFGPLTKSRNGAAGPGQKALEDELAALRERLKIVSIRATV